MNQDLQKASATTQMRQSSDRQFGLVMAGFFLLLTLISAWKRWGWPYEIWPALSFGFAFFALLLPKALYPLNKAWTLLGKALHLVVSPLVMGSLYFLFFTPFGLLFRWVKGDPLRLKLDKNASTYWIEREEKDQPGSGMANQF
jgi:hypothetical protein